MIQFVFVNEKKTIKSVDYLTESVERIADAMGLTCDPHIDEELGLVLSEFKDIDGSVCALTMNIDTYGGVMQLLVQIDIRDPENFNEMAYKLKGIVKEELIKDWKQCVWLEDSQSALYAQQLYPKVYKIENMLRKFINVVMVNQLGISWWENHVSDRLYKTYDARHVFQRRTAPLYKNVDAKLISIDTDQLTAIMKYQQKKWQPVFDEAIESLIVSTDNSNAASLKAKLQTQLTVEKDSWDIVFAKYFKEGFIDDWDEFCNYRNHVAHNKLIDKQANATIRANFDKVEDQIKDAFDIYNTTALSDEDRDRIATLSFEAESEFAETESGVKIKDSDEIQEILNSYLDDLAVEIEEDLHFRNDLEIIHSDSYCDMKRTILTITSKVNKGLSITVTSDITLDGSAGGRSMATVTIKDLDETADSHEVIYLNGESYFNEEQGNYMPLQENELIPLDHESLIKDIRDLVDVNFPNKIEEISAWNFSQEKDGGPAVVGDFLCEECGEETVSIYDEFHDFGVCVSCGHDQSGTIKSCLKCETYYNSNLDGIGSFCEGCVSWMRDQ